MDSKKYRQHGIYKITDQERTNIMNQQAGKLLIIVGVIAIIAGIIFIYGGKTVTLKYFGKLPGDINIKRENFSFYFPVTTCILISVIITFIFRILSGLK